MEKLPTKILFEILNIKKSDTNKSVEDIKNKDRLNCIVRICGLNKNQKVRFQYVKDKKGKYKYGFFYSDEIESFKWVSDNEFIIKSKIRDIYLKRI